MMFVEDSNSTNLSLTNSSLELRWLLLRSAGITVWRLQILLIDSGSVSTTNDRDVPGSIPATANLFIDNLIVECQGHSNRFSLTILTCDTIGQLSVDI